MAELGKHRGNMVKAVIRTWVEKTVRQSCTQLINKQDGWKKQSIQLFRRT